MTEYTFTLNKVTLNNVNFKIPDLGPNLNPEIKKFYEHFLMSQPFDDSHFNSVAIEYFNSPGVGYQAHDNFFTNLTTPWTILKESGRLLEARRVWETALSPAQQWEKDNSPHAIHKGTPYYFLAVTAILSGDLDLGFLLMHQALSEDNRATGEELPYNSPARALATLDYQYEKQYFREEVLDTAEFLDKFLTAYRNTYRKVLTLDEFRNRLFKVTDLKETFFLLVFTLFKFKSLIRKIDLTIRTNDFAGLIEIGALFDLCLVIDSVIHYKNTSKPKNKNKKENTYIDHMAFLSDSYGLSLSIDRLIEINNAFIREFPIVIAGLLNGTWTFKDGTKLSPSEADLALSYGLRNFSAHRIQSIPVIYENIEDIFQRVINVLFLSVEKLYSTAVSK